MGTPSKLSSNDNGLRLFLSDAVRGSGICVTSIFEATPPGLISFIKIEASFLTVTLPDALARHGKPEIFSTDQGS
jgi:hypothetical protein